LFTFLFTALRHLLTESPETGAALAVMEALLRWFH